MIVHDLVALPELVRRAAADFGDSPALMHARRPNDDGSFADLQASMLRGDNTLSDAAFTPGEPVLLLLESRPEWAVALFAIWQAGLVAVPLAAETPRRS